MPRGLKSSLSNVNFDTENDTFDDEIYFGDSEDNIQETEVVSVDVSQPSVAPHRHEPYTGSGPAVDSIGLVTVVLVTWYLYGTSFEFFKEIADVLTSNCLLKPIFHCIYPGLGPIM